MGWWEGTGSPKPVEEFRTALRRVREPVYLLQKGGELLAAQSGVVQLGGEKPTDKALPLIAFIPGLDPRQLGDPSFCDDHGVSYPYMTGAMANGIASVALVTAIANGGLLGSFGAGGLMPAEIEKAIHDLKNSLGRKPFCVNLIHTPQERGHEDRVVDLFLKYGVHLAETSAYMALTPAVVRYRVTGIHQDAAGNIVTPNNIIAKASRIEVAKRWFSPPPEKILRQLVESGAVTELEAELAGGIPMARDLTMEADSGGHTDNRPAITLLPTIIALRDRLQAQYQYTSPLRVGLGGGIATPTSAAAAFAMGAAYIVTGTINQACVESGSSDLVRQMLAAAEQADVTMAPAVDMFEMGVKLQVLKRGTMFAMRGNKLYELYRAYNSIEEIPAAERQFLEEKIFRSGIGQIWRRTEEFFRERDPAQIEKANRDPKHKMALLFRWYLGLSSRWANAGIAERQVDYQIWCGPAMGAFNEWVKGSFLEEPVNRKVVTVAMNLIYGAALVTRLNMLRNQGIKLADELVHIEPLADAAMEEYLS